MTTVRAALFDMDGVLIDSLSQHRESWMRYCRKFNIQLSQRKFDREYFGHQGPEIISKVFGDGYTAEERQRMSKETDEIFQDLVRQGVTPVAGVKKFVKNLKQLGIPMALATSGSSANTITVLEGLKLDGEFSAVLTEEDVTHGKPDPSVYLLAAGRLGIPIHECVVFEDTPVGILAAKSAGAFCVALTTTTYKSRLTMADAIISDFEAFQWSDISALLKKE